MTITDKEAALFVRKVVDDVRFKAPLDPTKISTNVSFFQFNRRNFFANDELFAGVGSKTTRTIGL